MLLLLERCFYVYFTNVIAKVNSPFDDDEYITELKLDGMQMILSKFDGTVSLYSRHHNEVTSKFPELLDIDIPDVTILDGELIVADLQERPDFEAMMEWFRSRKSEQRIQYCVFNVVYYEGQKVTLPRIERKELLDELLEDTELVVKVKWLMGTGRPALIWLSRKGSRASVLK